MKRRLRRQGPKGGGFFTGSLPFLDVGLLDFRLDKLTPFCRLYPNPLRFLLFKVCLVFYVFVGASVILRLVSSVET